MEEVEESTGRIHKLNSEQTSEVALGGLLL